MEFILMDLLDSCWGIVLLSFNIVDKMKPTFVTKSELKLMEFTYLSCANELNSETKYQRDFELLLSVKWKVNKFSQFTNNDMSFLSLSWRGYFLITIETIPTWEEVHSVCFVVIESFLCSFLFVEWKVYGKDPIQ